MFKAAINVRRILLLAALGAMTHTYASAVAANDPKPLRCCFTNLRYAGVCQVEPSKDQTCGSILAYLNNPSSAGSTYCSNTSVRGGWKKKRCKP